MTGACGPYNLGGSATEWHKTKNQAWIPGKYMKSCTSYTTYYLILTATLLSTTRYYYLVLLATILTTILTSYCMLLLTTSTCYYYYLVLLYYLLLLILTALMIVYYISCSAPNNPLVQLCVASMFASTWGRAPDLVAAGDSSRKHKVGGKRRRSTKISNKQPPTFVSLSQSPRMKGDHHSSTRKAT
jgi:hypothetical protein